MLFGPSKSRDLDPMAMTRPDGPGTAAVLLAIKRDMTVESLRYPKGKTDYAEGFRDAIDLCITRVEAAIAEIK